MWKSDLGQIHNLIPGNVCIKKLIICWVYLKVSIVVLLLKKGKQPRFVAKNPEIISKENQPSW